MHKLSIGFYIVCAAMMSYAAIVSTIEYLSMSYRCVLRWLQLLVNSSICFRSSIHVHFKIAVLKDGGVKNTVISSATHSQPVFSSRYCLDSARKTGARTRT